VARDWDKELKPAVEKRRLAPAGAQAEREPLATRDLSDYSVRRVEWLERPFWQRNCYTLFTGKKGVCKGTLLAGLAARTTRGKLYDAPKRVLVVTSEDSVELDFKPRLLAAGGDDSKGMVEIVTDQFRMPGDLDRLKDKALEMGDVGLIILDPIGNHLGGVNTDQEGIIRNATAPLNDLADELGCLIVGVRHLSKDVSRGALASVLGSTAWVDVPRCVIGMAQDDEDEMLFHYQVLVGNRGPKSSTARAVRLELVDVDPAVDITLLIDAGAGRNIDDILTKREDKSPSKSAAARELVLDILEAEGPQESDALDARVAAETGISAKTIRNLRGDLSDTGLIRSVPDRLAGQVQKWTVQRTQAPR
jgi:hypothetical protein